MLLFFNKTKKIACVLFLGVMNFFNLNSQAFIKNEFSTKQIFDIYHQYNPESRKLIFVYLNLNNCYNCSQGLRWLAKADILPQYKIYYLIEGISAKKLNAFKREYHLKNDILLLPSESSIATLLKIENTKFEKSASVMIYMDNPCFYTSMSLTTIENLYHKELYVKDTTEIKDSLYYTSFNHLSFFNKNYYCLAAPKNILLKINKQSQYSEKVDFDSLYTDPKIMESVYFGMSEDLKKCNTIPEICNNFNTMIKDQGYNKTSIINFEVKEGQLIMYVIFYYPLWKDIGKTTISLKPFPAILSLNKNDQITIFKPLNISNAVEDSFFYESSNVIKTEPNNKIRISLLPNGAYSPEKYFPLEAVLSYNKQTNRFSFETYGPRYRLRLMYYDTGTRNNYLLSYVEDAYKTKFFKSHNHFIRQNSPKISSLGNFDSLLSDSLSMNYFVASASSLNDSISNLLVFIKRKPYILKVNTMNGALIDFWHIKYDEKNELKNFNACYLEKNVLHILCFNNRLESHENPKIFRYLLPK